MRYIISIILTCLALLQPQKESAQTIHNDSPDQAISWETPADGGTPKDHSRITQTGINTYHVRAAFEEGGESVLKHAVSRMDLICRNSSTKAVKVTLEIDLSQDGKRTDFNNKPEAGMPWRDFIFIKSAGGNWMQVTGITKGWLAIIQFEAGPGKTAVGLSPWYTYSDYLSFIGSLQNGPFLHKEMIGKTDGGLAHWELTITDTSVGADKKEKIFWQAREHAYETFSSFAMEGLISFLLSEKAAAFRKKYVITIHPMTNIDGVARGYEYRAGYDFPQPRTTQTGKMTFDAVDRLKPDYAVAWHNWISPRDRNVVFYTDQKDGVATPRAWLRFTQLFPSLRAWQHRWKDEDTPSRYNWQGKALGDQNIHQYAMKHYGTRIWGWEMPWWNFTVDDARSSGAAFALAFLTTIGEVKNGTVPDIELNPLITIARFDMHEFNINKTTNGINPWQDAGLVGEFISPTGKKKIIDGFYDGNGEWKLRFSPDEEGAWKYRLRGEGISVLQEGNVTCTSSAKKGYIGIHPFNSYAFAYSDTTAFFPMGDTNYGLFDDSPITPESRTAYLITRRQQHFNFVRMEAGHSQQHAMSDPSFWAWGGTALHPDMDQFNPAFFRRFDSVLLQMKELGMNAELILLNFYRLPFTDCTLWTPKRENAWLRYLVNRYAAFDNIFMWTISNEYETHPDGKYRLDTTLDVNWVKSTAATIRQNDPYHHLVTVHPVISSSTRGGNTGSSFEHPWRIGGFFGADSSLTVLSQQTGQSGNGVVWDNKCKCWNGDAVELTESIGKDRQYHKPVLNTENGYEFLKEQPSMRNQVHHTDKVRRSSWRIVCAGGYFAAGFSGTIGHSDIWNLIDAPNHYRFLLKDEGAASQLSYLYQFFEALPFWRFQPTKNIRGNVEALADEEGKMVVIYFPHGGRASLPSSSGQTWEGRWYNPRSGKFLDKAVVKSVAATSVVAPDKQDWALLIQPKH